MAQGVSAGNADTLRGRFGGVDMARTGINKRSQGTDRECSQLILAKGDGVEFQKYSKEYQIITLRGD